MFYTLFNLKAIFVRMTDQNENPYSPPVGTRRKQKRPWLSLLGWLVCAVGVLLLLSAASIGWRALELANLEHLHWWVDRRAIYDIEIDGVPITVDEAIRMFGMSAVIAFTLSVVLMLAGRRMLR